MNPAIRPDLFRHAHPTRVRMFQVDRQNVVHAIWYFFYFEEGRVEYLRDIGLSIDEHVFVTHTKYFIVENTCTHLAPATFDDELSILTRIASVGNTSIRFEHLAMRKRTGEPLAFSTHTIVHVNPETNRPERVPDPLREMIRAYEGKNVDFGGEGQSRPRG